MAVFDQEYIVSTVSSSFKNARYPICAAGQGHRRFQREVGDLLHRSSGHLIEFHQCLQPRLVQSQFLLGLPFSASRRGKPGRPRQRSWPCRESGRRCRRCSFLFHPWPEGPYDWPAPRLLPIEAPSPPGPRMAGLSFAQSEHRMFWAGWFRRRFALRFNRHLFVRLKQAGNHIVLPEHCP